MSPAHVLPIFQKVNGDWLFLANLKVPPSGGGGGDGGGGTAAGGGGAIIIYPMPDGGTPPTNGQRWQAHRQGRHLV